MSFKKEQEKEVLSRSFKCNDIIHGDNYIIVTDWTNGEGYDIEIEPGKGYTQKLSLTREQIKDLIGIMADIL